MFIKKASYIQKNERFFILWLSFQKYEKVNVKIKKQKEYYMNVNVVDVVGFILMYFLQSQNTTFFL